MFTLYMLTRIYNRTLYDVYYTVCNKHWYMQHSEKCTYGTKWRANSVKWYLFISQVCTLCILFIVPCTMYMQFTLCTAYSIDDAWDLEIYTEQWSVYIIQYIFILSNLIHNPFELKCMLGYHWYSWCTYIYVLYNEQANRYIIGKRNYLF